MLRCFPLTGYLTSPVDFFEIRGTFAKTQALLEDLKIFDFQSKMSYLIGFSEVLE
jgi:hypothetical protein